MFKKAIKVYLLNNSRIRTILSEKHDFSPDVCQVKSSSESYLYYNRNKNLILRYIYRIYFCTLLLDTIYSYHLKKFFIVKFYLTLHKTTF